MSLNLPYYLPLLPPQCPCGVITLSIRLLFTTFGYEFLTRCLGENLAVAGQFPHFSQ